MFQIHIDALHWTSPEEVALTLAPCLDEDFLPGEKPSKLILRGLILLMEYAPPSMTPHLLRVAADRSRPWTIRCCAMTALGRFEAPLLEGMFATLLEEQPHDVLDGPPPCGCPFPLPWSTLIRLCRRGEEHLAVLEHLKESSAALQEQVLQGLAWEEDPALEEIKTFLLAAFPDTSLEDDELDPKEDPPVERTAANLDLPLADLLGHHGAGALRKLVRKAILEESFFRRCPIEHRSCPAYQGAIAVLEQWEEGPFFAIRLLLRAVLHPDVRCDVGVALLRRDRNLALRYVQSRVMDPEEVPLMRALVGELAKAPHPGDGDALWAAIKSSDDRVGYHAVDGLQLLREGGAAWERTLLDLMETRGPFTRIASAFVLAQASYRTATQLLLELGSANDDVAVRAEAVRRLGMLDTASDHLQFFEHVLRTDHETMENNCDAPAAEQAALALLKIGSSEAQAALLRGFFVVPSGDCFSTVYLALKLLHTMNGASPAERWARMISLDSDGVTRWRPFRD